MRKASPILWFLLLLSAAFSLATVLQPKSGTWSARAGADSLLKLVLGDGRRLFADMIFRKADIYFHGGYYPSIFDQANRPQNSEHMSARETHQEEHDGHDHDAAQDSDDHTAQAVGHDDHGTNHVETAEEKHIREMDYLRGPRDWIERFGRNFVITEHTHLSKGDEREILPWLRLTAELDPQKIDTYTVAAFWLRSKLGKPKEAEQFLREGLKANPDSYEILYELGLIYNDNLDDPVRARNVWDLALRRWAEQATQGRKPDEFTFEQITTHLAVLEEKAGNLERAIEMFGLARKVARIPEPIDDRIKELRAKLGSAQPTHAAKP